MHIRKKLRYISFMLSLAFIASILSFVAFETESLSIDEPTGRDMSYLLDCGYIQRNISNTIFHPDFVVYLFRQQEKLNTLNEHDIKDAVDRWNAAVVDKRKEIHYKQEHFYKMAMLSRSAGECGDVDDCLVDGKAIAMLRYWMSDIVAEVANSAIIKTITPSALDAINVENNKSVGKALEIITGDPVGRQLVSHAVSQDITIKVKNLHDHKGWFEYANKTIVIDPTVASYIFKINCIVHELIHASSTGSNSVTEETLAEIIAMSVQDRVSGVDISCSPYVVFVDRLLDPHYGKYPVRSGIAKRLQELGIKISIVNHEIE